MTEGSHTIRRWIMGILVVQVGFALILMGADVMRSLPALLSPSQAPALLSPVGPGDQRRRFDPGDITFRTPSPGTRPVPATQDMPTRLEFTAGQMGERPALTLTGTIAPGDGARFADWIGTHVRPEIVFLNSPGGSVTDAIEIGRQLRRMGIETAMTDSDICLSACPYVLAGGTPRDVAPGAMVGVHQHYFGENIALPAFLAVEDIQRGQGEVMGYLIEMGIDPAIMEPALLTPPDEIYVLLPEELKGFGLIGAPEDS
ncbi:hypothetical protein JQU17_04070 [Ponticoccus sp. SC2-23]|uniref:COG3904 family protein n=1 Tax=Alexandriicola marinus TaxID=2081710 RepID=UPI000FDA849F|nr:hypothetical protein [Alexandriicola marinus]MBM1219362.1 hypothetical protein [Ponticoccus sp. SC6-9]MBM1223566.1 hypothetical protein [Ponticoccus sp. SC6-15]MBM1229175.1 hypothetical protein [Ponticoccus sp. SC6-38]MBM1232532.1 hypothetical protein [Ponticoccus sp. SC6-45]MBM1237518.1 hypothetical protein [Ponticoccus sp. SC6-49]MBM1241543.1 hypothetical protein [Ponticoccus sp. SC2-64]MBM1246056.1 hypothetical protein [Ponticoccus sp. SC6-42]MBM1250534.1 hypothetical protein [Pontico